VSEAVEEMARPLRIQFLQDDGHAYRSDIKHENFIEINKSRLLQGLEDDETVLLFLESCPVGRSFPLPATNVKEKLSRVYRATRQRSTRKECKPHPGKF
jgi:hypothetical protein